MGFGAALGSPFLPAVQQSPTARNAAGSGVVAARGEHAAALLFKNLQNTQTWAGLLCPAWLG